MKSITRFWSLLFLFILIASMGRSLFGDVVHVEGLSRINWTKGYMECSGYSGELIPGKKSPSSEKMKFIEYEAFRNARRNLFLSLMKLPLQPNITLGQKISGSVASRRALAHVVENCTPLQKGWDKSGFYQMTLRTSFFGSKGLSTLFYYQELAGKSDFSDPFLRQGEPVTISNIPEAIVLDVRSKAVAPVIAPTIIDESGETILQLTDLPLPFIHQNGYLRYIESLDEIETEWVQVAGSFILARPVYHNAKLAFQVTHENAELLKRYFKLIKTNKYRQNIRWFALINQIQGS